VLKYLWLKNTNSLKYFIKYFCCCNILVYLCIKILYQKANKENKKLLTKRNGLKMGALTTLSQNTAATQEELFDSRFGEIMKYFECELSGLPFESTPLETLKFEYLPNIIVYVDYAIKGFGTRWIELLEVDVMNTDDEYLPRAGNSLRAALQELTWRLNEACEKETEYELSYHEL